MKHDYQAALDRIKRNVMPCDAWAEEDWEHFETVKDALELAASVVRCKDCKHHDKKLLFAYDHHDEYVYYCLKDACPRAVNKYGFCESGEKR